MKTKGRVNDRQRRRREAVRFLELVQRYPRYGYRFITAKLRQEGWRVNAKRIYRLWRREGLKVPRKKRKKRRLGTSANGCHRRKAQHKNDVWAWDFRVRSHDERIATEVAVDRR